MRHGVVTAVSVVVFLATACGGTGSFSFTVGGDDEKRPQREDAGTVDCGGSHYDPSTLADAPPVSSLPDGPAGAVDDAGAPAFDPSQDWRVVFRSDSRVDLVRELEEREDFGGGDVRTHESRTLERITGAPNVADGTWMLASAGPCTQRLVGDGVGEADLMLADEPSPDATSIDLLVRERACASGRTADGRIELVELEETDEQVRLWIGVRRLEGGQDCQGNPATPFTVELAKPLGDREIVDASLVPARPLTVDAAGADEANPGSAPSSFEDPALAGTCEAVESAIASEEPGAPTAEQAIDFFVADNTILEQTTIEGRQIKYEGEVVGRISVRTAPAGGFYVSSAEWCYPDPDGS